MASISCIKVVVILHLDKHFFKVRWTTTCFDFENKRVRRQKPRRTKAPRFCQLGQKPRNTFKHIFYALSDISIIFFQSNIKLALSKLRALDRISRFDVHMLCLVIHVAIKSAIVTSIAIDDV